MSQNRLAGIGGYLRQHWRRVGMISFGSVLAILVVIQLLYPWNNLPLYQMIDNQDVGNKDATATVANLNSQYQKLPLQLYFGNSPKIYRQPTLKEVGITVTTERQVKSAAYSWWLRLVPTSLWWAHSVIEPEVPTYTYDKAKIADYIKKELGQSCDVKPVNASLEYKNKKLQVVPAIDGGTCQLGDVQKVLQSATPRLAKHDIRIKMNERPAAIHDDAAKSFTQKLTDRTSGGIKIKTAGQTVTASQSDILSWLDFTAPDSGIVAKVNSERSKSFFDKQLLPKVSIAAGVSKVTTLDFTEISRSNGSNGQTLDVDATIASLNAWLANSSMQPEAKTKTVAPSVSYTRTYTPTDTGFTALITQFAQGHPGTFGVSFAELDGQRRHAGYQDTKVFRTASTYKLFVAYGALKRVESNQWRWTDQINGGRDLTRCLDDMIVKSDNPCGETMLGKIGYATLTKELQAIGLPDSSFTKDYPKTTAKDLTTFVGALQSGQLLNPSSTSTLLSAMKRNIYRQGIPAGATGTVADKVGFLDGFLHDAAIVYSPTGTYVLSIMTDGSSWGTIAELTRQIQALRVRS